MPATQNPTTCPHLFQGLIPSATGIFCEACDTAWSYRSPRAVSGLFLALKKALGDLEAHVSMLHQAMSEVLHLVTCRGRTVDENDRLALCGRWFPETGPFGFFSPTADQAYCPSCLVVALLDDPESVLSLDPELRLQVSAEVAQWVVAQDLDLKLSQSPTALTAEVRTAVNRLLGEDRELATAVAALRLAK